MKTQTITWYPISTRPSDEQEVTIRVRNESIHPYQDLLPAIYDAELDKFVNFFLDTYYPFDTEKDIIEWTDTQLCFDYTKHRN